VLYYWAPFLLGALLTVGVVVGLVAVARRSAVFAAAGGPEQL
jgi:hypothetical protein